jgi:hypothetical protein
MQAIGTPTNHLTVQIKAQAPWPPTLTKRIFGEGAEKSKRDFHIDNTLGSYFAIVSIGVA